MRSLLTASKVIRLYVNSNKNLFNKRLTFNSNLIRFYRFTPEMSSSDQQYNDPIEPFRPKRALILVKFSRYEFEKRRNPGLSEEEFIRSVSIERFQNIH